MLITSIKKRANKRLIPEQQIINILRKIQKPLYRGDMRNLKVSLQDEFTKVNLKVGRDTLFNVLRKYNIPTLRKKTSARTTNSYHRSYKYNNIIKDIEVKFYLDQTFTKVSHAKRVTKNPINLYNEIRLHLSLDYKTPNMVYKLSA